MEGAVISFDQIGYTNTGAVFRAKTRALEKSIQKAFPQSTLHYLDGPIRLKPSDIPGYPGLPTDPRSQESDETEIESYAWWRRRDPPEGSKEPVLYGGIDEGIACIANAVRAHGPFDGVIGFSQGACAAAITASLLEGKSRQDAMQAAQKTDPKKMTYPESLLSKDGDGTSVGGFVQGPLKFAVIYSGFAAPAEVYGSLYSPKISTPSLHVLGSLDVIVDESRSKVLIDACENATVVTHPGGHFCPSTRDHLDAVVGFLKATVLGKQETGAPSRGLGDERVEDMDMPF